MLFRLILIILTLILNNLSAQTVNSDSLNLNIELRTYLDQDEVPQNREVIYHVELSWIGELNRYRISDISDPVVTNLKLRGSGSSNRFFNDANGQPKSVKRITYYFTPVAIGMAYIDGVTIQYEDEILKQKETLSVQRLGVKITEPLPDPNAGMEFGTLIVIIIVIVFFIIVAYFVIRYFQQRKLNLEQSDTEPQSLEEKYLDLLKNSIDLSSKNRNENLNILTKLLNSYMTEKYQLPSRPGYDLVAGKLEQNGINPDILEKIKNLYDRDELSKFAGEEISVNEFHLFFDTVELLITRMNAESSDNLENEE